jgi:hypothetical protein
MIRTPSRNGTPSASNSFRHIEQGSAPRASRSSK